MVRSPAGHFPPSDGRWSCLSSGHRSHLSRDITHPSRRSGSNRRPTAYKVTARRRSCCLPADTWYQPVAVVPHVYAAERISCHEWCHATQMRPNTRSADSAPRPYQLGVCSKLQAGLWSAPPHLSAQGAQVTVDLRGMSVGAATRVRGGLSLSASRRSSRALAAICGNGTRTVVSGTGSRLTTGMSL